MKVSSIHPIIVSDDPEKLMEFYAALGFTPKHSTTTVMSDPVCIMSNGDVELEIMLAPEKSIGPMPFGLYGLKMNVDDLDAAVEIFKQNGGTVYAGPFENEWTKVYLGKDADGNNIVIMKHIKKKEAD